MRNSDDSPTMSPPTDPHAHQIHLKPQAHKPPQTHIPPQTHQQTTNLEYINKSGSSIIKGRFGLRFVREVGSGYAGTVFKCLKMTQPSEVTTTEAGEPERAGASSPWVAVKVMHKLKIKPEAVEREARLLRLAKGGPCVLQYIAAVECVDSYLLVTEYCSQGDLHSVLPFLDTGLVMARDYMQGVALGLSVLHDKHIAHCDIKMRNIVIDGNNVPKIADFGFAIQLQHRREKTSVCHGTKDYWAPEMWQPRPWFNPFRADVYALAVTFLGVCHRRPIKRKDNDLRDLVKAMTNPHQKSLFKGLLHPTPHERSSLAAVKTSPWITETMTPPPSP